MKLYVGKHRALIWAIIIAVCCFSQGYYSYSHASAKAMIFQSLLVAQRASGVTLTGGKAYFYIPGSMTLATIYANRDKTVVAANPYTLDANGTASVYGDGLYDVQITDSANVQKYYWLGVQLVDYLTSGAYQAVQGDYSSLNHAIRKIGNSPATLEINAAGFSMTGAAVVPSTLAIHIDYPGSIANTYSLSINGPFQAGLYQVFTGSGAVSGLQNVWPEWWGITGTNDDVAINAAFTELGTGTQGVGVFNSKPGGVYNASAPIKIPGGITWNGNSSIINSTSTTNIIQSNTASSTIYFGHISDLILTSSTANYGFNLLGMVSFTLTNVNPVISKNLSTAAAFLLETASPQQCYFNTFINCQPSAPYGIGWYFVNGANVNTIVGGKASECAIGVSFYGQSNGNHFDNVDIERTTFGSLYAVQSQNSGDNVFRGGHFENYSSNVNLDASSGFNSFDEIIFVTKPNYTDNGIGNSFDINIGGGQAETLYKKYFWQMFGTHYSSQDHIYFDIPILLSNNLNDFRFFANSGSGQSNTFGVYSPGGTVNMLGADSTVNSGQGAVIQLGQMVLYGHHPPSSGTYPRGSLFWNTSTAVGQAKGWMYDVTGTWRSMGNL